ncbi:N-acetylmuramic acid 6-phosphate etherase [Anaerophaga thermohalophila]|uniref:N-acetylmuramic acid 6-phosphate etherase n=1 Tax=Anaerophaga thermohalophila TaxID=177400 RepID=UPI000237C045|nr:N-acetylmuramic acid 6-phosphate etherase [Anaerophaga thermohalophila]MDI3520464.1 N-acetylmuramic acid 6-phosphate etherase [Anaerophaga sp.]
MSDKNKFTLNITESPSRFKDLEKMEVADLIRSMNEEDAKVHIAVREALPQIEQLIVRIIDRMKQGGRLFYLGAGTSGRLGVLDASELPPTFGVPDTLVIGLIAGGDVALRKAVEDAEDDPHMAWEELKKYNISKLDTVIGIAASGTTPYVIGGIRKARKNGILTGCITCNPDSDIAKVAEFPIEAIVGPEFITGSTRLKAGTAQKMILNMITTTLMIKLGKVKGNKMVNMQLNNQKLIKRGTHMLMEELNLDQETAQDLLIRYGSVKKAIDGFNKSRRQ